MRVLSTYAQDLNSTDAQDTFFVSFCDLLLLIATFFLLLLSMSKIDTGSFERLRSNITGSEKDTLVELSNTLSSAARGKRGVSVSLDEDGVRINLDSAALFETASAEVKTSILDPIIPVLTTIKSTKYKIDIEGHTDDRNYYRYQADSIDTNWSLSGRRASSVVHYLLNMGFDEKRLRIVGYAANRPKVSTENLIGDDLDHARSMNRRVSILVH